MGQRHYTAYNQPVGASKTSGSGGCCLSRSHSASAQFRKHPLLLSGAEGKEERQAADYSDCYAKNDCAHLKKFTNSSASTG